MQVTPLPESLLLKLFNCALVWRVAPPVPRGPRADGKGARRVSFGVVAYFVGRGFSSVLDHQEKRLAHAIIAQPAGAGRTPEAALQEQFDAWHADHRCAAWLAAAAVLGVVALGALLFALTEGMDLIDAV